MKVVMFSAESKPFEINFWGILELDGKLESNFSHSEWGKDKEGFTRFKWDFSNAMKDEIPTLEFTSTLNNLWESSIQICMWEK